MKCNSGNPHSSVYLEITGHTDKFYFFCSNQLPPVNTFLWGQIIVPSAALMLLQRCISNEPTLTLLFFFLPLFPLPSLLFLSLCSFPTPVTSCAAQKITRLIIRHFIWQRRDYVCAQSPIHLKVSTKVEKKRKLWGRKERESSLFVVLHKVTHGWAVRFDLQIDRDQGLCVCVCSQPPKLLLGLESKDYVTGC